MHVGDARVVLRYNPQVFRQPGQSRLNMYLLIEWMDAQIEQCFLL